VAALASAGVVRLNAIRRRADRIGRKNVQKQIVKNALDLVAVTAQNSVNKTSC
jgi:hypothetical protein